MSQRIPVSETSLARGAMIITIATAVSRVTGFVRVIVVAWALGTTFLANTYQTANTAPNLVFELVAAGVLTSIFVPTFVEYQEGGRFVSRLLGSGWAIATLFVLPIMVVEGIGPLKAFHRSRVLLKEQWGAHQQGVLGTGLVFLILFSIGLVPFVAGVAVGPGSMGWAVAAILYWLVLSALWSVVHGILVVTLYHYATDSEAAFGFNWQALNHPWIR